jgi:hypothetical protein
MCQAELAEVRREATGIALILKAYLIFDRKPLIEPLMRRLTPKSRRHRAGCDGKAGSAASKSSRSSRA